VDGGGADERGGEADGRIRARLQSSPSASAEPFGAKVAEGFGP
jgi:hypothetical protein